jgi:arylsulfatase A-like enzyme/Flp pilus assembly protein TadD
MAKKHNHRTAQNSQDNRRRNVRRGILALLVVLIVAVGFVIFTAREEKGGNLLLITLDTVRADRISCYGSERVSTPSIDHIARDGVLFENAIAPAPLTLPSHTTIMTGLYPNAHGIRDNSTNRISEKAVTLAEILSGKGYETGAVVGAFILDSDYGLSQGFQYYNDELPGPSQNFDDIRGPAQHPRMNLHVVAERPASDVTGQAISWLKTHMKDRFFLWIHYYDPHHPYEPPPPYSSIYADRPYEGEIAFVDQNVGMILSELMNSNVLDETLILLVGDHGEALGEHKELTHSIFTYESSVRVPLIMRYPVRLPSGARIAAPVSLADVVPTVLDLLDVESDNEFNGVSLLDMIEGERAVDRYIYCESMSPFLTYGWSRIQCLRGSQWKYIRSAEPELYDLASDPGENNNLIRTEREVAEMLEARLDSILAATTPEASSLTEKAVLAAEDRERLRALGYVTASPPPVENASLQDPKEMIQFHNLVAEGEEAMARGRFDEALDDFRTIIASDPANAVVHNLMGTIYAQMQDTMNARIHFQKAIDANPNLPDAHHNLGNIYHMEGKFPEAAQCYERALELDPAAFEYYVGLGQIYARIGDFNRANDAYRKAIENGYASPQLYLTYAHVLSRLGKYEEAMESLSEAIEMNPEFALAYNEYGNIMDMLGNTEEAISKYRMAVSIRPEYVAAHCNLARLMMKSGNAREAAQELSRALELNPDHAESNYLLGELLFQRGQKEQAKQYFQKFLALNPDNLTARKEAEERLAEIR